MKPVDPDPHGQKLIQVVVCFICKISRGRHYHCILNFTLIEANYKIKSVQVEEPMTEASKYLRLLQNHSPNSLETHLLSFEVYMRKQKFLLAFQVTDLDPILSCFYNMLCPSILRALLSHFSILQAVKQLLKLDAENPDSHRSLV